MQAYLDLANWLDSMAAKHRAKGRNEAAEMTERRAAEMRLKEETARR